MRSSCSLPIHSICINSKWLCFFLVKTGRKKFTSFVDKFEMQLEAWSRFNILINFDIWRPTIYLITFCSLSKHLPDPRNAVCQMENFLIFKEKKKLEMKTKAKKNWASFALAVAQHRVCTVFLHTHTHTFQTKISEPLNQFT